MNARLLVLIIESDAAARSALADLAQEHGYDAAMAEDGVAGLRQFFSSHPDIVVASLDGADLGGWDMVERIRALAATPIIVTARDATLDSMKKGFDLQVDGFLVKPFEPKELVARLNALRDRVAGNGGQQRWVYKRNGLEINWRSCDVFVSGEPVALTGTEYRLLQHLVEHRGWVLSHDQILSEVWGPEYVGEKERVKLYVWYLRQKIEHDPKHPKLIVTKRGLGYTFVG
ncbi:MAG: response regulator transcription factor [Dehalococcoidia bacterium]